jgi:hypothetical protein
MTTLKSTLFIPPGQYYCGKDTSVGKVTECKLNDLGFLTGTVLQRPILSSG